MGDIDDFSIVAPTADLALHVFYVATTDGTVVSFSAAGPSGAPVVRLQRGVSVRSSQRSCCYGLRSVQPVYVGLFRSANDGVMF